MYINYLPVDDADARIFMIIYFDFRKENPRFFLQYKHRLIADLTKKSSRFE